MPLYHASVMVFVQMVKQAGHSRLHEGIASVCLLQERRRKQQELQQLLKEKEQELERYAGVQRYM